MSAASKLRTTRTLLKLSRDFVASAVSRAQTDYAAFYQENERRPASLRTSDFYAYGKGLKAREAEAAKLLARIDRALSPASPTPEREP